MLVVIPRVWPASLAPRSEGVADMELQFLGSIRLNLRLPAWAGPADRSGARGLRPVGVFTEYHCESEVLGNFCSDSTGFSTAALVFGGPKCVSVVWRSPKGEFLKAVLMPLTCMQRQGEMWLAWSWLLWHGDPKPNDCLPRMFNVSALWQS